MYKCKSIKNRQWATHLNRINLRTWRGGYNNWSTWSFIPHTLWPLECTGTSHSDSLRIILISPGNVLCPKQLGDQWCMKWMPDLHTCLLAVHFFFLHCSMENRRPFLWILLKEANLDEHIFPRAFIIQWTQVFLHPAHELFTVNPSMKQCFLRPANMLFVPNDVIAAKRSYLHIFSILVEIFDYTINLLKHKKQILCFVYLFDSSLAHERIGLRSWLMNASGYVPSLHEPRAHLRYTWLDVIMQKYF